MLHIVTGPPAAGKSTYIREHATPGAIRIDYDLLANVFAGIEPANHEHPSHIKAVTTAARSAAIAKAEELSRDHEVWIIHSTLSEKRANHYRELGARIHIVDPGKDIVMTRCKRERPKRMLAIAAKWYDQDLDYLIPKSRKSTTQRGYGYSHQKDRERLLYRHVDSTACWWCGQPMYRDRTKNPDYNPLSKDPASGALHADHSNPNGQADRLLHERCNKSRGHGDRDHLRPALQPTDTPDAAEPSQTFQWA
ncbi:hypothetical protein [Ancrocorticia populi]|uniref:hypothetical protein n=1 Tax=Ancrocorticia populi TaxID=2175228 RepID=UPI003F96DC63